jgi:hypothetical protein
MLDQHRFTGIFHRRTTGTSRLSPATARVLLVLATAASVAAGRL